MGILRKLRVMASGNRSARSWYELAVSAVVVSAVVILARFVWVYPAVYVPRWISASASLSTALVASSNTSTAGSAASWPDSA